VEKITNFQSKMNLIFCTLLLSLSLLSCSTLTSSSIEKRDLSLDYTKQLKPGTLTHSDIKAKLGNPDKIVPILDPSAPKEAWLYLNQEKDSTRISFIFDQNLNLLSTHWFTDNNEKETVLQFAINQFPQAHFIRTDAPWTTHHYAPNEQFYIDQSLGITITYLVGNRYVESISFSKPTSPPTSQSTVPPTAVSHSF
jgi:hypothetical protein